MEHEVVAHEELEEKVMKGDEEHESIRIMSIGRDSQQDQQMENMAHSTSSVSQQVESKHSGEHVKNPLMPASPIVMDHEKF